MDMIENISVDNEFDPIKKFKDFEKRSRKKWKPTLERIKEDRKYLGGDQLAKEDIDSYRNCGCHFERMFQAGGSIYRAECCHL